MPTVSFIPIPNTGEIAKQLAHGSNLEYPGAAASTVLSITPVAGEDWTIEGLSLDLVVEYFERWIQNTQQERGELTNEIGALTEQFNFLVSHREFLSLAQAKSGTEKESLEYSAQITGVQAEEKAVRNEIEKAESERNRLGSQFTREQLLKESPLVTVGRLFTHTGELVWQSTFDVFRVKEEPFGVIVGLGETWAEANWKDIVKTHIQFSPPVHLESQQNLRLEITVIGPGFPRSYEGGQHEGPDLGTAEQASKTFVLLKVQGSVNYSGQPPTREGGIR